MSQFFLQKCKEESIDEDMASLYFCLALKSPEHGVNVIFTGRVAAPFREIFHFSESEFHTAVLDLNSESIFRYCL